MEFMGSRSFSSMEEFCDKLQQYERDSGTTFVVSESKPAQNFKRTRKTLPATGEYSWIQYVCIHTDRELNDADGVTDRSCPAMIRLVLDPLTLRMRVSKVNLRHSHSTLQDLPEVDYQDNCVTYDQGDTVIQVMDSLNSVAEIRNYVRENYGMVMTGYDIRNLRSEQRRQSKIMETRQLLSSINDAILKLGTERYKSEMTRLSACIHELKECLRPPKVAFNPAKSAPLVIPPEPALQTSMPPKPIQLTIASPASVQPTNVPSTSTKLTNTPPFPDRLKSIPSSAVELMKTPTTRKLNNTSSAQALRIPSAPNQPLAVSAPQLLLMPSSPVQVMTLLPSSAVQLVSVSPNPVKVENRLQLTALPPAPGQLASMPPIPVQLVSVPTVQSADVSSTTSTQSSGEFQSNPANVFYHTIKVRTTEGSGAGTSETAAISTGKRSAMR